MAVVNSLKALFQSMFVDEDDDGDPRSFKTSPPKRRADAAAHHWAPRAYANERDEDRDDVDGDDDSDKNAREQMYVAKPAEGEYNVWFHARPLGMGLVPSTQLYGSWEVSSMSAHITQHQKQYNRAQGGEHVQYDDNDQYRHRMERGDVLIAVNFSCKHAQLPRDRLFAYLQSCVLPIAVTLRKPSIYGSLDSRSMVTAMYPLSIEYEATKEFAGHKRFTGRASSAQWKRTLQHQLSQNVVHAKHESAKQLGQNLVNDEENANTENRRPSDQNARDQFFGQHIPNQKLKANISPRKPQRSPSAASSTHEATERVKLSTMGEYDVTFNEHPIHLVLAPSTRMYGSVEIYDPKVHAVDLEVGDVVIAVNGDTSVSRWPTDDLIDYISELQPPVRITFRRPVAYRQYLEKYFRSTKPISSQSVANAMFPNSAEYKRSPQKARSGTRKQLNSNSPPQPRSANPKYTNEDTREAQQQVLSSSQSVDSAVSAAQLNELRDFSFKINSTDQFKLWSGGGRSETAQRSTILTEKHVRFLWTYLPQYLSCNEMELAYSTRYHGWNLLSFYSMLEDRGPTILVIQDTRDNIFGAFCSSSWQNTHRVYGNGRSFVFTLRPQMKVFQWSGRETSFMYSKRDAIFVGGGKKGIALCLQLDEMRGFSKSCETFDNPPLAEREIFECEVCEVWSFSGLRI
ncbi:Oxidation resistance protein, partial [Globisporangium splendens]